MAETVDDLIARAKLLEQSGNAGGAIALADDLVERYENDLKVWLLRAHLYALSRDYEHAAVDMTRAIEMNAMEPHLFFTRGTYRFELHEDALAIEDFTEGLRLCDHYKNDYYRETLYFWRAEALLRLGNKQEALEDLARVSDGFSFWTYELRTKRDLMTECTQ